MEAMIEYRQERPAVILTSEGVKAGVKEISTYMRSSWGVTTVAAM